MNQRAKFGYRIATESGFGLAGFLIAIAVSMLMVGGGFYVKELRTQKSLLQIGEDKTHEAQALKEKIEQQFEQNFEESEVVKPPSSPVRASSLKPPAVPPASATTKLYRSEMYKFEFRYPIALVMSETSDLREVIFHESEDAVKRREPPVATVALEDLPQGIMAVKQWLISRGLGENDFREVSLAGRKFMKWFLTTSTGRVRVSYGTLFNKNTVISFNSDSPTFSVTVQFVDMASSLVIK